MGWSVLLNSTGGPKQDEDGLFQRLSLQAAGMAGQTGSVGLVSAPMRLEAQTPRRASILLGKAGF